MIKQAINLQDVFLNQVRKERIPVIMYLTNGNEIRGNVRGFDSFTVVVESDGKQQLVYKHAIANVCPVKAVNLIFNADNNNSR
jgi:host factor-I protein